MARRRGRIVVSAGTNGAGKTSIVGEFLAANGGQYFNPDAFARKLMDQGVATPEANAAAWNLGFDGLRRAVDGHEDFSFETTLGGNSIVRELHRALKSGLDVRIFYVGLASPQLHVARVAARVARGGHAIAAAKIHERYSKSLANLLGFIGKAQAIDLFDNSDENASGLPTPRLIFRMRADRIVEPSLSTLVAQTPSWAKPVVAAALKLHLRTTAARRGN